MPLVARYCAIPRDYLSDTPLLRAMGFLVSQHGQLGAIPPPPFLSMSPLESIRKVEVRYPPPQKGISAILARYPMKTREMGAIPPSAILSRKGIASDMGGYLALIKEIHVLVAQCSATPASVTATPPCSATPFQRGSLTCDTPRRSRATGATGPFSEKSARP